MADLAVVTGAGGSIGLAVCRRLLADGYRVAGFDISASALDESRAALGSDAFLPLVVDVTSGAQVDAGVQAAVAEFGTPAVLVNNAGAVDAISLGKIDEAGWMRDIDRNLNAAWRCINAVRPLMKAAKRGAIVNISSVNGLGVYGYPAYSAAKAGLIHLTKFAAVELGPFGIRTNAICPGSVRTKAWAEHVKADPNVFERVKAWYPLGDICEPEDVADLVSFVVSPQARMLNGAIIPLDGGISAGSLQFAREFLGAE